MNDVGSNLLRFLNLIYCPWDYVWLFCLLWCRAGMSGKQMCQCSKHRICPAALCITFVFAMWPASEVARCPPYPNVAGLKVLKFNQSPGHSAHTLLCTVRAVGRYIKENCCRLTKTSFWNLVQVPRNRRTARCQHGRVGKCPAFAADWIPVHVHKTVRVKESFHIQ